MTEDQRKQADLILQQYSDRVSELSREREASFEQAVAKTKEILTPAQREKYEELLKRRPDHDRDGRGGHGPSGPPPAR
jgi:Spy/CpxP family protein refolding chaperone